MTDQGGTQAPPPRGLPSNLSTTTAPVLPPPPSSMPIPSLDLSGVLDGLPNPRHLKTASSICFNKPFDGSFKPQAYCKHRNLPDQFRASIPAPVSDRCLESFKERICRLKMHEETLRRHGAKAFSRVKMEDSCAGYAEARSYAKDMFKDVHVLRDEADLHHAGASFSYSRIDQAAVEGKRPQVYDYDEGQTQPRTAGYSPGHIRSLSVWPPLECIEEATLLSLARPSSPDTIATSTTARSTRSSLRPFTAPARPSSSSSSSSSHHGLVPQATRFDTATLRRAYGKAHADNIKDRRIRKVVGAKMRLYQQRQSALLKETMEALHEFERLHLQGSKSRGLSSNISSKNKRKPRPSHDSHSESSST